MVVIANNNIFTRWAVLVRARWSDVTADARHMKKKTRHH